MTPGAGLHLMVTRSSTVMDLTGTDTIHGKITVNRHDDEVVGNLDGPDGAGTN